MGAVLSGNKTKMERLTYDTEAWPFKEVIEIILEADLYHLNTTHYDLFDRDHDQSSHWHKKFYANNDRFLNMYFEFVAQVIKPRFNERIVFQKIPTFRVQLRDNVAVGEFHKDSDYGHSVHEVNFWLPFTDTNELNTIWIEDKPYTVKYGEVLVFDGANLKHGNKINTSPETRVSVDFRVMPYSKYKDSDKESINTKMKMKIGDYYELL